MFSAITEERSIFESKLFLTATKQSYDENEVVVIQYAALNAYTYSVVVFNEQGKKVITYNKLAKDRGEIRIGANFLSAGLYQYALIVNGRMVFKKKMMIRKDVIDKPTSTEP